MDKSRLQIEPGIWVDARRAIWFERLRILAVADLHIGYNWAHRHSGQLLPLHQPDDTIGRLQALYDFYRPDELLLLGDIVHRALPLPQIQDELQRLLTQFKYVRLIAGNHDRFLQEFIATPLHSEHIRDGYFFIHGHLPCERPERVVMGHEHPAISVGDGVATSLKCPCFLISRRTIVLPAFSLWAAGGSEMALRERFDQAVAILGDKLLPIHLK